MATMQRHRHLLVCLAVTLCYLGQAGAISVAFGTSGGSIVPPTPSPPTPPPRPPYREPAAVWEDQSGDIPNPNPYKAPVPPQLAHIFTTKASTTHPTTTQRPQGGQTRYTHVVYNKPKPAPPPPPASTLSSAQSFVKAYAQPTKIVPTQSQYQNTNNNDHNNRHSVEENYQSIEKKSESFGNYNQQVPQLGVRYIPGYGYKYITPDQDKDPRKYDKSSKYFHDKYNAIESNNVYDRQEHPHDVDLSYDKFMAQRVKKSPEQTYVPHQPFTYYHQPQLFFPINYVRH